MKVYAVTAGEYSDYHIVTILDNKEKAKKFVEIYNSHIRYPYDAASIEEYDTESINICINNPDKRFYQVESHLSNNWEIECYEIDVDTYLSSKDDVECCGIYRMCYCMAKDEEHAKKIATDIWAKKKAEQEGI